MQEQNIKKNYIYNTLYRILTLVTPLITTPYTARIFGAEIIGIQSYVGSILAYFMLFAALGTAVYGQREIATCRDDKKKASRTFWEIEFLSVFTTVISLLIWILLILKVENYTEYYIILTINIVGVAFDISWFFGAYEQFRLIVVRNTIIKAVGIVILFLAVNDKSDIFLYLGLTAASGFLGTLSMWTYLPRFLIKVPLKGLNIKRHFKQTMVYFVPTIATTVYTVLDKTMIGLITKDTAENGYYEQTSKITKMMLTIITSLNTVMSARMSYLFATEKIDEIKKRLKKSMDFVMFLSIPMVFGIMGIAGNFVPWFFGEGYEKVIILLYVYSPLIIIIGISNCIEEQYLTPSGQRARSSKSVIVGAAVNFCFNLVLIPILKSVGAAIASIIGEGVITIMCVYMSDDFMNWKIILKLAWKRALAGMLMLGAVIGVGVISVNILVLTILQIVSGIFVYFGVLILIKDESALTYARIFINKVNRK